MNQLDEAVSWVVYKMTVTGKHSGVNAVCQQSEWNAMELAKPGRHTLVQSGITIEGEAERLARVGTDGAGTVKVHFKVRVNAPKRQYIPRSTGCF